MLKRVRNGLLVGLGVAITIRVLWDFIAPVIDGTIPLLVAFVLLVTIGGVAYHRSRRW
jgi:hypothetical protein